MLCSTGIAVGFVGLMLKIQQNETPYDKSVTVNKTIFTKLTLVRELLFMNCHTELRENSTNGLVADEM